MSAYPAGTIIGDRFVLDRVAGSGGMGTVYRARDRVSSEWIALKVLNRQSFRPLEDQRFIRESRILAELRHPGIVAYVDSGLMADGVRYLAMEWLMGEDLSHRLERGVLSVHDCVGLLAQIGAALAVAHQLDIVHRDIKPSNLFLCSSPSDRIVLLDFGVAHYDRESSITALTIAGAVVGTLHYMAPEQAAGGLKITPAADIYALGRVAYQSLAGRRFRQAAHAAAALARAMFEQEPPLSALCPWVPEPLSNLIARMLAKDPTRRPPNGTALLAELAALGSLSATAPTPVELDVEDAPTEEQFLYSIVLAVPSELPTAQSEPSGALLLSRDAARASLEDTLLRHRAQPRWLLDGSLLLTMLPSESAHDQAAQAARCALIIKAQWPDAAVAVATGRGQHSRLTLVGEVVDRAARLLREQKLVELQHLQIAAAAARSAWVDGLSASLLERRFVLLPFSGGALLTGEALSSEDARPVLGVVSPCFGRERELAILDAMIVGCASESLAQAVLVTAPPGQGKTRLRQEFLQRLRRRSRPPLVLMGTGEMLSQGTPYAVLGRALRQYFGIDLAAGPAAGRARLSVASQELLGSAAALRYVPFLGELCGLRYQDEEHPELRSARGDPQILTALLTESFVRLLDALCQRASVLLLFDDLHWGDLLTINLVDAALRELEARPLIVLALARPEIKETFPKIRYWPHVSEIPLSGLSRSASENFVRFILGSTAMPETVKLLAQQSAGNALLLEELIRAQDANQGAQSSETVIAILQARIQRLAPQARTTLSKASVLGLRFWRGGILAMEDPSHPSSDDLDVELRALAKAEFVTAHRSSSFPQDVEYSFRHILMRDAVYGLLTDEQKRRWHLCAGRYLVQAGEPDAMVLAEHFSCSDEPRHALCYFVRAAALALESNDLERIRSCVQRAQKRLKDDAADSALRGELLAIWAISHYRIGDLDTCVRLGIEAIAQMEAGGNRWAQLLYTLLASSMMMGRQAQFLELANKLMTTEPLPDARASYIETHGVLLTNLCLFGQHRTARDQIARIQSKFAEVIERQAGARAWFYFGQNRLASLIEGSPWMAWQHAQEAVAAVAKTGNPRWISIMQVDAALAERDLGSPDFEAKLRAAIETLRSIQIQVSPGYASIGVAVALSSRLEHAAEASELARGVLARNSGNAYFAGMAHLALAQLHATAGDPRAAELMAREALSRFITMPPMQTVVFAVCCRALLDQGRISDARIAAEEGLAGLDALDGVALHDLRLRLVASEAFDANGDRRGADAQLTLALSSLRDRARSIPDPDWRKRYLENVPEHARLLALAVERLGQGERDVQS